MFAAFVKIFLLVIATASLASCGAENSAIELDRCETQPPRGYKPIPPERLESLKGAITKLERERPRPNLANIPGPEKLGLSTEHLDAQVDRIRRWFSLGCPGKPDTRFETLKVEFDPTMALSLADDVDFMAMLIEREDETFAFWWVGTRNDGFFDFTVAIHKETNRLHIVEKLDWSHLDR